MIEGRVPPLPEGLIRLRVYLLDRDIGGPRNEPQPRALVQTVVTAGWKEDRIEWDYTPPMPTKGHNADGFIVFFERDSGAAPMANGIKVSYETRAFTALWPDAVVRSYAVAAFRNTHQGEQRTQVKSILQWLNVTG